jgi:pyridoxal phosphate enzyme (YggS family)
MSISQNIQDLKLTLPKDVTLVAVSKTKPNTDILDAYNAGQRIFGENKIQEMVAKFDELPKDIKWHMIGHLQRNKIKYMAHFVELIHGVDSLKTLKEINKQAQKHHRVINCLLQAKIAEETTKFGLSFNEVSAILNDETLQEFKHIKIVGLMGMASFTSDNTQVSKEFSKLNSFFNTIKNSDFKILSMGMSGDYKLAIKNGSNMIRVGSSIFGQRQYL